MVVLHIATVDEVVAEGADDGEGVGEAGGLHDADIRTGEKDFLQEGVAHIVVVVVQHDEVVYQGAEDGRAHEDEAALLQGFLRHSEVHGLDGGVRIGDGGEGRGNDAGIVGELGEEAVDRVRRGASGVALPDEGLDALVNLLDKGVHDILLERQVVLGRVDADEVFGVLAEQGLRANLAVHLDGGGADFALGEGDFVQGVEGATATVLEDGGQVEVVQEGVLLDARLEADAGAGGRTHQAEGLDEDFPVGLHIGREGIDEEVGNCHFVEFLKVSLS